MDVIQEKEGMLVGESRRCSTKAGAADIRNPDKKQMGLELELKIDTTELDAVIQKAERLVALVNDAYGKMELISGKMDLDGIVEALPSATEEAIRDSIRYLREKADTAVASRADSEPKGSEA